MTFRDIRRFGANALVGWANGVLTRILHIRALERPRKSIRTSRGEETWTGPAEGVGSWFGGAQHGGKCCVDDYSKASLISRTDSRSQMPTAEGTHLEGESLGWPAPFPQCRRGSGDGRNARVVERWQWHPERVLRALGAVASIPGIGPNPVPFETRLVLQSSRASPQRRRSTSGRCPSRSPARAQPCHTRPCPVNPRSWTRAPKEERRTPAPALLLCTADPESRAAGGRDLRRALPRDGEAIGKEKLAPGLKTLGGLQVTHSRFPPTGGPVVARPAELAPLPCAPAPFPSHRLQDVCRCRTPILPC